MDAPDATNKIEPLARLALRHRVVHRLISAIVSGELAAGTRLVAKRLAERLGVSATPIREALVELEQMGVVKIFHNRGAVAGPFGRRELREVFHIRRILEREATLCAAGRIDLSKLAPLKVEVETLLRQGPDAPHEWLRDSIANNRRFHGLIADHCGNGRLCDEIRRYASLLEALIEAVGDQIALHREMLGGHVGIADALLAGNASAAAEAMARYVDDVGRCLEQSLFDHQPES
ncbi:MAG: GntR family transcriptional regulator [Thermoguttaceae bacterium]|jgi:DNA-binding GntR family transcriptional regulator